MTLRTSNSDHRNGKSLELPGGAKSLSQPCGPHLGQRRTPSPALCIADAGASGPQGTGSRAHPTALRSSELRGTRCRGGPSRRETPCLRVHPDWRRREQLRAQGGGSGPTQPHARVTPSRPGPTPSSATPPGWAQFRRSPRAEPLRAPHLLLPGSG